jgi:hypothetical protein
MIRLFTRQHAPAGGAAREVTATNPDAHGRGGRVLAAGAARVQSDEACEAVPHGRAVYTGGPSWR